MAIASEGFVSQSIFFVPVRFSDFTGAKKTFETDKRWKKEEQHADSAYLFPYVSRIVNDEKMFCSFVLKEVDKSSLYLNVEWMKDEQKIECLPTLTKIRFSGFATNIGFLEYHIRYDDSLSIGNILDFVFYFKKALPKKEWVDEGKKSLYEMSNNVLPNNASDLFELFFTSEVDYKKECKCFHAIKIKEDAVPAEKMPDLLRRLARSYNNQFNLGEDCGENDMVFSPYSYSQWCGSPDTLANIIVEGDEYEKAKSFINTHYAKHISCDYYYTYLILLNQRFSLLNYLDLVSKNSADSKRQFEIIQKQSMEFNSFFSFRVVSDDLLYQSIYTKMYKILNIDELIEDMDDNEKIVSGLYARQTGKNEEIMSTMLICISVLSLFSALVDASGFFDRFHWSSAISTLLSISCVVAILLAGVLKIRRR